MAAVNFDFEYPNHDDLVRYTFFWRTENKDKTKVMSEANVRYAEIALPAEWDVKEALEYCRNNPLVIVPKGSHRSGCYEIHTEEGIYAHVKGSRIDFSTPRKAAKVAFTSWDGDLDDLAA